MMKNYVGKNLNRLSDDVVVFDLDGTLWKENSHIDILNKHFHTKIYNSLPLKCIAKLFLEFFQQLIDRLYRQYITEKDIQEYTFRFRESAIQILKEQMSQKKRIMIISNAPSEIVDKVKKQLKVEAYISPIGDFLRITVLTSSLITEHFRIDLMTQKQSGVMILR